MPSADEELPSLRGGAGLANWTARRCPLRQLLLVCALACSSCAAPVGRNIPIAPGGSVTDFDRGAGGFYSPETGTPAGQSPTVGALDFESPQVVPSPAQVEPPPPPLGTSDQVTALQRQLKANGYYDGPVNGQEDPALLDALRRYKAATPAGELHPDGGVTK